MRAPGPGAAANGLVRIDARRPAPGAMAGDARREALLGALARAQDFHSGVRHLLRSAERAVADIERARRILAAPGPDGPPALGRADAVQLLESAAGRLAAALEACADGPGRLEPSLPAP